MEDHIIIEGARQNNLKNINVSVPVGAVTVVTGVAGAGKSSLAFEVLYAEGYRRYVETFSPYARQFLERLDRPDADRIDGEIVYEQRFGARNQFELVVPFGWREVPSAGDPSQGDWTSSVGDIAVGVKRAFWHSLERGAIVSATAEFILPTGDEENGFGKGTTVFEPFVSYGQILPADFFLHGQAGFEIPFDTDVADNEAFLRAVLGWSTTSGLWGRTWSPMVELLGARELVSGAETDWDIAPQIQITLNTRQHIMMNIGVRTPLNNTEGRSTQVVAYLLWDWFDGTLFEGW